MKLKAIPTGNRVFIDTNILLYSIGEHPEYGKECDIFFDRVKDGDIDGVISVIVLNELIHKLIIGEVAEREEMNPANVTKYLKDNKGILTQLDAYEIVQNVEDEYNLTIADIYKADFDKARKLMRKKLLLSNDALHIAVMDRLDLENIATDDPDFKAIEKIKTWKPSSFQD